MGSRSGKFDHATDLGGLYDRSDRASLFGSLGLPINPALSGATQPFTASNRYRQNHKRDDQPKDKVVHRFRPSSPRFSGRCASAKDLAGTIATANNSQLVHKR